MAGWEVWGMARWVVSGLVAVLLAVGWAGATAWAHDELIGSDPADGASVTAPEQVVLTFNTDIIALGAVLEVSGPAGPATDGDLEVSGPTLSRALVADLTAGDYTVDWRITSTDGHPISGTFGFTVEAGSDPTQTPTESPTSPAEPTADPTDEVTTDPTEETTDEPTPTAEPTATPTIPADPAETGTGEEPVDGEGGDGVPGWAWAVAAVALVGLAGLVMSASRRAHSDD